MANKLLFIELVAALCRVCHSHFFFYPLKFSQSWSVSVLSCWCLDEIHAQQTALLHDNPKRNPCSLKCSSRLRNIDVFFYYIHFLDTCFSFCHRRVLIQSRVSGMIQMIYCFGVPHSGQRLIKQASVSACL